MTKAQNKRINDLISYRPVAQVISKFSSGMKVMEFKSRGDQISHTLPTTRHSCNFDVWALAQRRGVGHRSLL